VSTTTAAESGGLLAGAVPPYARSWVNVFTAWMERLPGPTWLAYAAAIALSELVSVLATQSEATTAGSPLGAVLYYGALPFAALALIHSLDRTAIRAVEVLRPDLAMDDAEVSLARHQLTIAPARPALLIAVFAFVITPLGFLSDPVGAGIVGYSPVALAFRWFWESLIAAIFLILIYHTVRQLRLIARIHERVNRIDVFDQARLYAMSKVTSGTAIGLVVLLVPSLFLLPQSAGVSYVAITIAWYAIAVAAAAASFFLPLRGMHDRLVAEKRRLQAEIGRRISTTLASIQNAVDADDTTGIESANKALSVLVASRDVVNRVPTWPWSGGALTGFASAIVLPIVIFLVQRVLAQVV
jgi:hypothetical protein